MSEKIVTIQINGLAGSDHKPNNPAQLTIPLPELEAALNEGYTIKEIIDATPESVDYSIFIFHLSKKEDKD